MSRPINLPSVFLFHVLPKDHPSLIEGMTFWGDLRSCGNWRQGLSRSLMSIAETQGMDTMNIEKVDTLVLCSASLSLFTYDMYARSRYS